MASVIKAQLSIDGMDPDIEVQGISYSIQRYFDELGQPSSEPMGGRIEVSLMSHGKDDRFGWMVAPDLKKNGTVKFIDANGQTVKTLTFTDAYCVGYSESYSPGGGGMENLSLSCRKLEVGGQTHENTWTDA